MLQGERVKLRSLSRDDLPRLCAFNNDLAVELAGGGDPPLPQSLARLQAEFDQDAAKGGRDTTKFAIEVGGAFIGVCVLFHADATARTAELGIAIGDKDYWGRGHGRECVRLLLTYAFTHLNYRKVWLRVHAANERAVRAYLACGFAEEGRQRAHVWCNGEYDDLVLLAIFRDDWRRTDSARTSGTDSSSII